MLIDAMLPKFSNPLLHEAMRQLNCNQVELIPIEYKPHTRINRCHANVELYVRMYGGQKILGYYVAVSATEKKWVAIKHSVWSNNGRLIDITPVDDERTHNVFIWGATQLYTDVYSYNGKIFYNNQVIYEDTFANV